MTLHDNKNKYEDGIVGPPSSFHFIAGLSTGVLSAFLLQPTDLLKTRVQQSGSASLPTILRDIMRGPNTVKQLWRGTLPSVVRTGFGSALYFTTLNALRQSVAASNTVASQGLRSASQEKMMLSSSSLPRLSNLENMGTGAVARASAGMVMMPITIIKARYESSLYSYNSVLGAGVSILEREGVKGLFSGFGATVMRDAPYAGLYVLFYEQCKRRLSQTGEVVATPETLRLQRNIASTNSIPINFLSGLIAAGLATAITNPFDAIKTRLQLMPNKYSNLIKASKVMIRKDGLASLFRGLGLRMIRKALSSALAWTIYEELIRRAQAKW